MDLIDGKMVANGILERLGGQIGALVREHGLQPGLAVVLVGDDPASQVYVGSKARTAEALGIFSVRHDLPTDATQADVEGIVDELNQDDGVHGILVQSPPPPQIDERAVTNRISPDKDVDCFHPNNVGRLLIGDDDGFVPCTPLGIMALLNHYGIEVAGRHAVVIGRSNLVGKPIAVLLARKAEGANATVTLCHSRTTDLAAITRTADIIISAVGAGAGLITADMVKDGAVVIDVGANPVDAPKLKRGYRLVGDVAFEEVSKKCSWITPVPGGVGPMTIAMLMSNTVKACCTINALPFERPW